MPCLHSHICLCLRRFVDLEARELAAGSSELELPPEAAIVGA